MATPPTAEPVESFVDEDPFVPFTTPSRAPYDPEPHRERVRTVLVAGLVLIAFGGLMAIAVATAFGGVNPDNAAKAAGILSPVIAAATLAVGFYFRGTDQNR